MATAAQQSGAQHTDVQQERRRRVRRATLMLSLLALAIYVGFIALTIHRSHG